MNRVSKSDINAYAIFMFTMGLVIMVPMMYFTAFLTEDLLMSAALMGTIVLISRLIDIIVGLVSSPIMQRARQNRGTKHSAWLNVFRWIVSTGAILMFTDTSSMPLLSRVIIAIVSYCMVNCSMNFIQTAYFNCLAVMCGPSMDDRNLMSFRGTQFMVAATIITSVATLPVIQWLTPYIGNAWGYTIISAAFAIPLIFGSAKLQKATDKYDTGKGGGPVISVGDMVKSVFTNSQLLILLLSQTLMNIGTQVAVAVMLYYYIYILGNVLYMTLASTITTIFGLVGAMIGPKIGVKVGKKNAMVIGLFGGALSYVLIYFLARHSVIPAIIVGCLTLIFSYMYMGFGPNYVLDTGEYHLYKTGQDNRIVAMGLMTMPIKIGLWIGGSIGAYGLVVIGYQTGMKITESFIVNFMFVYAMIPAIFLILAGLVMLFGYHITDKDAAMYAKVNAEKLTGVAAEQPESVPAE